MCAFCSCAYCSANRRTCSSKLATCPASRVCSCPYCRLAGYEDLNDAVRVSADPTFRLIGSPKLWDRGAALTSTLHWFETELLTRAENLVGLMAVNREVLAQAEMPTRAGRIVLDMDSSESPVHGAQEGSAYNGHFESVCYHLPGG